VPGHPIPLAVGYFHAVVIQERFFKVLDARLVRNIAGAVDSVRRFSRFSSIGASLRSLFPRPVHLRSRVHHRLPPRSRTHNRELLAARDKLELLAQMDPLTEALNRHAFHSLLRGPEGDVQLDTSGSVAVIDIDNLKPINDTWGHSTGDKAIRVVARSMRSLIRADDMLFRWGGDEFLMLMFNLSEEETSRRMTKLNGILEENCRKWPEMPVTVTISHGVAGFDSLTQLGHAIELADQAMYARRNEVRGTVQAISKR
jgi:diguanylate cyclase (GGDEF)-like protein